MHATDTAVSFMGGGGHFIISYVMHFFIKPRWWWGWDWELVGIWGFMSERFWRVCTHGGGPVTDFIRNLQDLSKSHMFECWRRSRRVFSHFKFSSIRIGH